MTAPVPTTSVATGSLTAEATEAVQRALATEHAALWVLQLATAFVGTDVEPALAEATTTHRARRDATEAILRAGGVAAVAAEPAYATPAPVTDQRTAVDVLTTAEADVAAAWRSLVEHTDDTALRGFATDALVDSAVRATRWRQVAGATPLTVAFPGG